MKATAPRPGVWSIPRFLGLALCAAVLGCGTGEYDERMQTSLTRFERVHRFADLQTSPTPFAGGLVTLRLPKLLNIAPAAELTPGGLPVESLHPPFMKLPGATAVYSQEVVDPSFTKWPIMMHVCLIEAINVKDGQPGLDLLLKTQLLQQFPESKAEWAPVACETDSGPQNTLAWRRLTIVGEQMFDKKNSNNFLEPGKFPGELDLWLFDSPTMNVLLAWRMPDAVRVKLPTLEAVKHLTAGAMKTTAPEAWTPPAALAAQLGDPATVGAFRMRIPKNLKPTVGKTISAGMTDSAWALDGSPAGFRSLSAFVVDEPNDKLPRSLVEHLELPMKVVINPMKQVAIEKPGYGSIDGHLFLQSRYEGTDGAGVVHRGRVYVGRVGRSVVCITTAASGDGFEAQLQLLDAAVRSFSAKVQ